MGYKPAIFSGPFPRVTSGIPVFPWFGFGCKKKTKNGKMLLIKKKKFTVESFAQSGIGTLSHLCERRWFVYFLGLLT